jgi:hypothetical protein
MQGWFALRKLRPTTALSGLCAGRHQLLARQVHTGLTGILLPTLREGARHAALGITGKQLHQLACSHVIHRFVHGRLDRVIPSHHRQPLDFHVGETGLSQGYCE